MIVDSNHFCFLAQGHKGRQGDNGDIGPPGLTGQKGDTGEAGEPGLEVTFYDCCVYVLFKCSSQYSALVCNLACKYYHLSKSIKIVTSRTQWMPQLLRTTGCLILISRFTKCKIF